MRVGHDARTAKLATRRAKGTGTDGADGTAARAQIGAGPQIGMKTLQQVHAFTEHLGRPCLMLERRWNNLGPFCKEGLP